MQKESAYALTARLFRHAESFSWRKYSVDLLNTGHLPPRVIVTVPTGETPGVQNNHLDDLLRVHRTDKNTFLVPSSIFLRSHVHELVSCGIMAV